jgi:hypothetical protein
VSASAGSSLFVRAFERPPPFELLQATRVVARSANSGPKASERIIFHLFLI